MARKASTKSRKTSKLPARKVVTRRAPRKVDFDDEEAVLKEVCKELDLDPNDCQIKMGAAPNGYGRAYTISEGRHTEYIVMENDDEFEAAAREGVKADLQDEPGNFNEDFIASHININRLRDALHSDVSDSTFESLQDEAENHPMRFFKDNNIDIPEPSDKQVADYAQNEDKTADDIAEFRRLTPEEQWDTIGDEPEVSHADITDVADKLATAQLKDPMEYLSEIYERQEAAKKAIEIAGIDIEAATDEAVSTDGAAHFMCNYDGNYTTTKSGFIVWRHN